MLLYHQQNLENYVLTLVSRHFQDRILLIGQSWKIAAPENFNFLFGLLALLIQLVYFFVEGGGGGGG